MPEPKAPSEDEKALPSAETEDEKALTPAPTEEEKPEAKAPEAKAPEAKEPKAPKDPREVRLNRIFLVILIGLVLGYIAVFLTLVLMRYANYRGSEFDTAIFNQVIWLLARGKGAFSTIRGMNLFGDHMAPILFLLTPLYWLGGKAPALLTFQTVVLAVGAVPVYYLARDKIQSRWIAITLAATYLTYPAVQYVNLSDFHPEAIGLVCLLFAFLAIERKKFIWFYVLCGLAAICKEDMVLAVVVVGIVVYFLYDKRAGKWVTGVAFVYFLAAVFFLIPHFAPAGYQYSSRLGNFGKTPGEALKNFFLHPRRTFNILITRENLAYILELVLPVAFICFFAPVFLLPALPAFVINMISAFPPQHSIAYQYAAPIIPFVFIALIFGMKKLKKWTEGAFRARYVMAGVAVVVILSSLATGVFFGPSPIAASFRAASYTGDKHIEAMNNGIALIPANASVSAQTFLLAKLSSRRKIYQFPEPFRWLVPPEFYRSMSKDGQKIMFPNTYRMPGKGRSIAPQYVALDRGSDLGIPISIYDELVARLQRDAGYKPIYSRDGVLILKR